MREIKFRAWNKDTKTTVDLHKITPLALDQGLKQDGIFIPFIDSLIVMQYTGLKDKNGKEIYEGDIVEFDNQDPTTFTDYRERGTVVWDKEFAKFSIQYKDGFRGGDVTYSPIYKRNKEVIGNIYENPELLVEDIKEK